MKKIFIIIVVLFSFVVSKSLAQDMGTDTPTTNSVTGTEGQGELAGIVGTAINEFKINRIYKAIAEFPYAGKVDDSNEKKYRIFIKTQILIRSKANLKTGGYRFFFIPLDADWQREGGVREDELYYFDTSENPEIYFREWSSIAHGTLIVPFKLRTKDGRITGDATLGYYVGYVWKWWDLDLIPLISAGLSPISVAVDSNETDTKLGVTGAIGVVLKHTGNFQIGLVSGVDHIGGDAGNNYEYENDLWVSFMVGYNFAN